MGGMAAFIPSRKDPELNARALAKVREDKQREAGDGFDGTWVAHPDLVPVAREEFDARPRRAPEPARAAARATSRPRPPTSSTSRRPRATVTEEGLRNDVSVAIQYLDVVAARHRRGRDLQPDGGRGDRGDLALAGLAVAAPRPLRPRLTCRTVIDEELERLREQFGDEMYERSRAGEAREIFEQLALGDEFVEFLTLPAYDYLDDEEEHDMVDGATRSIANGRWRGDRARPTRRRTCSGCAARSRSSTRSPGSGRSGSGRCSTARTTCPRSAR